MQIINKFILFLLFISSASAAMANTLPPFTNAEINNYADYLIKKDLPKTAKKYYKELAKRNYQPNADWGLLLVDLAENDNKLALNKVNNLLKREDVNEDKLKKIRAELELTLAESEFYNNNFAMSTDYLNNFFRHDYNNENFYKRAKSLKRKLEKTEFKQNVNIGVILPLSGKLSHIGEQLQKTINFAIYKENTNNITLFFEDNKSSQDGSIEAATNLLSKNVRFVIGPILRENTLAANTVLSSAMVPLMSFSNDVTIAGDNVYINNINIKQESAEIAKFAIDEGYARLACLTPNNNYGNIEKNNFVDSVQKYTGALEGCESYNAENIDINQSIKKLLEIDRNERIRLAELRKLEQEFENLGNAMDDEKIARMAELKDKKNSYEINFNGIFIPTTSKKLLTIAPQLAFYDIDFSSGVIFLGPSSWDNNSILNNRGEHLHFTRFLSLKSNQFKSFAKDYKDTLNKNARLLDGFAYDTIKLIKSLDFKSNIFNQLNKEEGFNVLTGNVKFVNNVPYRVYGINKISRRTITVVESVKHTQQIKLPSNLDISKQSGFSTWFGF